MHLRILTPDKLVIDRSIHRVTLPAHLGRLQILKRHAPFVGALLSGKVTYWEGKEEYSILISAGWVSVRDDYIIVLTSYVQ